MWNVPGYQAEDIKKYFFVCECCQLAGLLEDQTAKLEQLVDFLVKIDGNDRIMEDMQLDAKGVTTSQNAHKLWIHSKKFISKAWHEKKWKSKEKALSKCLQKKQR